MSAGRCSTGALRSETNTENVPSVVPKLFVAEQWTFVSPSGKRSPELWSQVTATGEPSSLIAETENVAFAPDVLGAATVIPSGMFRIGGSVCGRSMIVIVAGPIGRGGPSGVSYAFTVRDQTPS